MKDHEVDFSGGEEIGVHLYFEGGYFGVFVIVDGFDAHLVGFVFYFAVDFIEQSLEMDVALVFRYERDVDVAVVGPEAGGE